MNSHRRSTTTQENSKQQPSRLSALLTAFFHPVSAQELQNTQNALASSITKADQTLKLAETQKIQIANALKAK